MNSGVLLGILFARSAILLNQKRLDLAGNHNGKHSKRKITKENSEEWPCDGAPAESNRKNKSIIV